MSWEQEITAVRDGLKPISMQWFHSDTVVSNPTSEFAAFQTAALKAGLLVVTYTHESESLEGRELYAFAAKLEQLWRVAAFVTASTNAQRYNWSDSSEYMVSRILGYSDEEANAWLFKRKRRSVGWSGPTLYLLISNAHREQICEAGFRAFPLGAQLSGITVFYVFGKLLLRRDAYRGIPASSILARASVREGVIGRIFKSVYESQDDGLYQTVLSSEDAKSLNMNITSKIEILTESGWI